MLRSPEVREAGRQRSCRHAPKDHLIARGTKLLILNVPNVHGSSTEMGYCQECAAHMIDEARRELLKIEEDLGLRRSQQ